MFVPIFSYDFCNNGKFTFLKSFDLKFVLFTLFTVSDKTANLGLKICNFTCINPDRIKNSLFRSFSYGFGDNGNFWFSRSFLKISKSRNFLKINFRVPSKFAKRNSMTFVFHDFSRLNLSFSRYSRDMPPLEVFKICPFYMQYCAI